MPNCETTKFVVESLRATAYKYGPNLVLRFFRLPIKGSDRRKTLVPAGLVPPKKWEVTKNKGRET